MRTIIPPAPARHLMTAAQAARRSVVTAYQAVCPIHGSQYVPAPAVVRTDAETVLGR